MNRKDQIWCRKTTTVFIVLRSYKPIVSRQWWIHQVVYLEHSLSRYVGTKCELEEAIYLGEKMENLVGMHRLV